MGEAIAAFRQAALTVRRACDACFYSTPVGTETQHEWFAHFASIHAESMEDGSLSPVEYCEQMEQIRDIIEAELDEMEEAHDLLDDLPLLGRDEVQELAALHRVTVPKLRAMAKARGHKPSEDLLLLSPHTLRPSPELRHFAAEAVCDGIAWNAMATTAEAHINSLAKATEAIRHEASQHLTAMGDAWRDAGLEPHDPSSHFIAMVPDLLSYAAEGREQRDARYAAEIQRWRDAYFALAPFEKSPTQAPHHTAESSLVTKRSSRDSRKPRGRKQKDEALADYLRNAWNKYEPEEGRRNKRVFITQLPEVRAIKTDGARERRIIDLLRHLDSALHLKQAKVRQARRNRR